MIVVLAAMDMEKFYLTCGLLGASFFVLRTILMLVGADSSDMDFDAADVADMDVDVGDLDADVDSGDIDLDADLDGGLKVLTIQGLTAFVMMFGLTGYALARSSVITAPFILAGSCAMGVFTMWLVAKMFSLMHRLESSGTTSLDSAIGEEGTVYLTIRSGDTGKVQISVAGTLRVLNARSHDGKAIATGQRVVVDHTIDGRILVVHGV